MRPFNKKAITTLIITGKSTLPKKMTNRKEKANNIAKYIDSSLEKNLFTNFLNKLCILSMELSDF